MQQVVCNRNAFYSIQHNDQRLPWTPNGISALNNQKFINQAEKKMANSLYSWSTEKINRLIDLFNRDARSKALAEIAETLDIPGNT